MFFLIFDGKVLYQHPSAQYLRQMALQQHLSGAYIIHESQYRNQQEPQNPTQNTPEQSIIKRYYQTRESNMRVPVQPYEQQVSRYQPVGKTLFRPHSAPVYRRRKK
jgi:hypothetical protein